jgi:hypothetical protein
MEINLMTCNLQPENEAGGSAEFRRKVRSAEVLSAAMEQLPRILQFTGNVSVVVQNGRGLKCGYEKGYFRTAPAHLTRATAVDGWLVGNNILIAK